jgi:hypothetical protein
MGLFSGVSESSSGLYKLIREIPVNVDGIKSIELVVDPSSHHTSPEALVKYLSHSQSLPMDVTDEEAISAWLKCREKSEEQGNEYARFLAAKEKHEVACDVVRELVRERKAHNLPIPKGYKNFLTNKFSTYNWKEFGY